MKYLINQISTLVENKDVSLWLCIKDVAERLLAGISLLLVSPIMIFVALLIVLDSRGNPFFVQARHGYKGRIFNLYKFRTMTVKACQNTEVIPAQKDDDRYTRLGSFLRRYSIDELPQLLNVVLGDMALVGPRPLALEHNHEYSSKLTNYWMRHMMKPGLTGLVQVTRARHDGNNLKTMQKRLYLDLYYIRNWSFWFDIKILLSTIRAVLNPPR